MIRILAAIIRALMAGGGQTAAPRPRRQVRPPTRSNTAGTFDKTPQPAADPESDFEKMVRQMFGVPEQEEREAERSAPPPPPPPPPRREAGASSRTARRAAEEAWEREAVSVAQQATGEVEARGSFVAQELTSKLAPLATELQAAPAPATPAARYASRLRRNPDAAREAFVYAEIFGPPLADR